MTPLELKMVDYVRDQIAERGISPSYQEIAAHLGVRSKSNVSRLVTSVVAQGKLVRRHYRARSLELPNMPDVRVAATGVLVAELKRRGFILGALSDGTERSFNSGSVKCAADFCQVEVSRGHAFCRDHYYAIPQDIREQLHAANGQACRTRDHGDLLEYQRVFGEACHHANKLGRRAA